MKLQSESGGASFSIAICNLHSLLRDLCAFVVVDQLWVAGRCPRWVLRAFVVFISSNDSFIRFAGDFDDISRHGVTWQSLAQLLDNLPTGFDGRLEMGRPSNAIELV